ncbi:unnamed protein product [Caenorhabditis bovis]|uniref:26S proteasome non-ATPase regulatory subunit 14 n=2 Tax=Chromadorea TaxID=119089 RepID=A0A8S1EU20_9PELO|nr:unnamed protein product [Caenorhabditis bovis]
MQQREYDKAFAYKRVTSDSWLLKTCKNYSKVFSKNEFNAAVLRRIPILKWLPMYNLSFLLSDIIAGLTVGVYNVPQAMSYATLAGLSPVYGLYTSFFPPLIYAIFGTTYHSSVGVSSLLAIMINKCLVKLLSGEEYEFLQVDRVEVVTSLCLLSGVIQTVMAILRCDKLMKFLSAPAISAITVSSCFYGNVMLLPKMLGLKLPPRSSNWFNMFYLLRDIYDNFYKTNRMTLIISCSTLVFLLFMKYVIEPQFKKTRFGKIPFPTELITIIVNALISYHFDLRQNYGVEILNEIPRGFPLPNMPRIDLWPYMVKDAVPIAIVSYMLTLSLGQIYSKKHKFRLDSNQELLAMGIINIGSSFFPTFTTTTSMSRTVLNESCGGRSLLSGVVSSICMLIVITWIGPLLAPLPSCVLAVIVVVAVRTLFNKVYELPKLWRYSKHDFWIMVLTSIITLISGLAEGVAAGIIFAICTIAIQSQQPSIKHLGQIRSNDFRSLAQYKSAKPTDFKIIRFDAPLIFTNVDKFLVSVREAASDLRKCNKITLNETDWTAIILDCHTWTYTDSMGIDAVKEIDDDLKKMNIYLLLANLKSSLRRQYEHAGILNQIKPYQLYPSIQDALDAAHELTGHETMERFLRFGAGLGQFGGTPQDSNQVDTSETVYISSLALLKMLKHGRAGVPMEVMGLMLGEFVDEYTVNVIDVFAMPQSGTGVSVEAVDPVFQAKMLDMLKQTGRPEMVVGWYHSHPGFGCWLSGVDINTQQSFEALSDRAVAVVVDPIQSVKGKVVIDAFRTINPQSMAMSQEPRQTTSNIGHLQKPSIQALIHGLNRHYYSIPIAYRTHDLEQKMLLNLNKLSWMDAVSVENYSKCGEKNKEHLKAMLKLAKNYKKALEDEDKMTEEELAIKNVGKQDPKRHIADEVSKMLNDNIVQNLAGMMATTSFQ